MLNGRARGDAHETMLDNRPMYSCLMVALRMEAWLMSSDGGKNDVTGRYYRGRYVAKLEPLCNRNTFELLLRVRYLSLLRVLLPRASPTTSPPCTMVSIPTS